MVTKQCEECDTEFEVDTSQRNWQHRKYCGKACQDAVNRRKQREKYHASRKQEWPQERTCIWCQETFLVHGPGGRPRKYCSRECYRAHKSAIASEEAEKRRQPKKCPTCGEAFLPNKYASKQKYCSSKCYVSAMAKKRYEKHGHVRNTHAVEFRKAKKIVKDRDGNQCRLCGAGKPLHVHHLDNSGGDGSADNRPENLMTLCTECHHNIHRVTVVYQDGEWKVEGKIFEQLGLEWPIKIA